MKDEEIIELYWNRDQRAIRETQNSYQRYCGRIAGNILASFEDREECLNDTWLRAWNSMPDQRPAALKLYLGRLTRWLCLDRLRREGREKRGGGEFSVAWEELEDCLAAPGTPEGHLEQAELAGILKRFLAGLRKEERTVFLARYWFGCSIAEIARTHNCGQSKIKTMLHRTRKKLQQTLREEAYL